MAKARRIRITSQIKNLKKQYDIIDRQIERLVVSNDCDRLLYRLLDEKKNYIRDKLNKIVGSEHYDFEENAIIVY